MRAKPIGLSYLAAAEPEIAMDLDLLHELRDLEAALYQPAVRGDAVRLMQLLHPRFRELSRSGREYSRDGLLTELLERPQACDTFIDGFRLDRLSENLALVTYRSANITPNGILEGHSLRASLWELTVAGWQLLFHQGTPTEAFEARPGS